MPKTKAEIKQYWKIQHDAISETYYRDKEHYPGGRVQFEVDHAAVWVALDTELVANGYKELPVEPFEPWTSLEERVAALEAKVSDIEGKA